jgi:penicillin-binding protein 1A
MRLFRGIFQFTKLFLLSVILSSILLGIGGVVAAFVVFQNLSNDLPPLSALQHKPSITTKIYDVNGIVLDELFAEELREKIVPLSQIPKLTQAAFIATEDQRFYHHYGIDPKRILGALAADLVAKQAVQGASTITQQLAKNVFLSREKSIKRKLKEVIMAVRLERTYTKDEILALYLNEIFFGDRVHGIASASKYYFGKDVKDLDLAESAILAGLPKSPNRFSPFNKRYPQAWKERQKTVLMLMEQQGYITHKECEDSGKQEVRFASGMEHSTSREAPYFLEYIKRQLLDKFGFKRVYSKGLKVYTTLDLKVQKLAERHFLSAPVFKMKQFEDNPDFGGSFLAIDPTDGSIRAMIGGRDFLHAKYNRAVQARRQPGSSFKPFVYAAAFASGVSPSKTMMDEPYSKWDPGSQKWWSPGNFGGKYSYEYVTLAYALAKSLNVIAVKTCEMVGVEKVIAMAQRLGISSPLVPNLTLALGSSEVTLLEMVSAYGSFANQGIHVNPRGIIRVEDADGQTIYEEDIVEREVLDEKVAYQIVRAMMGVVEFGTATRAKVPGYQLAGKTGTTQDFIDAWFIGYMPDLVVGMNVGFEGERKSMGKGMTGGTLIAPVCGAFLKEYVKMYQVRKEFRAPSGMTVVAICRESSLLPGPHCTEITSMAFPKGKEPTVHCHSHGLDAEGGADEETVQSSADGPPPTDAMGADKPEKPAGPRPPGGRPAAPSGNADDDGF